MPGRPYVMGNGFNDGKRFKKWLVGDLATWANIDPRRAAEEFGPRYTRSVEVKLSKHDAGDSRTVWSPVDANITLGILISGHIVIEFREPGKGSTITSHADLHEIGSYVIWEGEHFEHRWRAFEATIMMTVRWPNASTLR